jgi:hypothetical protein
LNCAVQNRKECRFVFIERTGGGELRVGFLFLLQWADFGQQTSVLSEIRASLVIAAIFQSRSQDRIPAVINESDCLIEVGVYSLIRFMI